jgi:hypothetical protein
MSRGILSFMRGNTIALIALFVALGGTSYAATTLAANSVGTKQLKKNAVTSAKIKAGAVTTAKIAAGAVTTPKIAAGAVTAGTVANDAITGDKILESSLGKVPAAANADTLGGISPSVLGNTMRFSGSDFQAVNSATVFTYAYMGEMSCASGDFYTPVHLPQGATVTGMTMFYHDTASASAGSMWLTRFDFQGDYLDLLYANAPTTTGFGSVSAAVTTPPVMANSTYAYVLIWRAANANGHLAGAELTYSLPGAAAASRAGGSAEPNVIPEHSQL